MIDKNQASQMGINIIQSSQERNALFDTLKTHFPQTIKDGQVSLNAIKMLLGLNESASNASGYELTFTGKGLANALYSTPCQKLLKLQESFTPQTLPNEHPKNAIIVGDNLDALKLLKAAYSEKIKMIYIDPPYNTTNENFIYPDNFRQDYKKILEEVGLIEIDENREEVESEDLKFFKNIQGSRTHSGWLSFMLPRLKLARDLLKEDGVIFISIDDNEQANLKLLCDEIFGEDNFVACLIWRKIEENTSSGGTMKITKTFRKDHEYIFCYAKQNGEFLTNKYLELPNFENEYKNLDNDPRGEFKAGSISMKGNKNSAKYYEIETPSGKKYSRVWRITKDEFIKLDKDKRIYYGKNGDAVPQIKIFINEERPVTPTTIFENLDSAFEASEYLKDLFNVSDSENPIFSNPKPVNLMKRILEVATSKNSNDIILDFFAGSGTTAQAVMELNAEDKGNREFILVQIDEEIKEDKSKSAYDFCKKELKSENPVISDITIERVKRAAQKIIQSSKDNDLNLGFKVYNLQDKAQITNAKKQTTLFNNSNLTPFDKALNLALQSGKTLSNALEIIIKDKLYKCEDAYFCVDLGEDVLEYLAKTKNEMIFLDGYEDIDLQAFLNLNASFKERLSVVY